MPENSGIIIKTGYVLPYTKGMGSAYGGQWRPNPNKPQDERYWGTPGEIIITEMPNGVIYRTKIGSGGRAEVERHETDHGRSDKHTAPHDHIIDWDDRDGHPIPGPPINYPYGVPEFKKYGSICTMNDRIMIPANSLNFETISEFERCIRRGAEVTFVWKGTTYGVIRYGTDGKITIYEANRPETEKICETPTDALEYMVGEDRLRDVITQVTVVERSL